jgi:predicted PurR-regulated permease PerM
MWIENPFFKYMSGVIMVLLTTLLLYYNLPVFYLILWFLAAIFLPILFSTLLYYILRPVVNYLSSFFPRYLSILLAYLLISLTLTVIVIYFIPELVAAVDHLSTEKLAVLKKHLSNLLTWLKDYIPFSNLPFFENLFFENLPKLNSFVYQLFVGLITAVTGIAVAIGLTPFILYYFLRDDHLFSRFVLRYIPQKYQEEIQRIMCDIDVALSGFITTQATIAFIVGIFLLLGYIVIGLPYPVALALFGMVFYVIPFLGTFIAIIPSLIVAATVDFSMILNVIIIMLVAHGIEAYFITPRMMSNTLSIHPLTVILLLLIGGSLFGVLGLILITPAYAIIKVFVWNIYKIVRLRYETARLQDIKESNSEGRENLQQS